MEIKKGYTLSQFLEYLDEEDMELDYEQAWDALSQYNEFLKRILKREMFVNEEPHPKDSKGGCDLFCDNLKQHNQECDCSTEECKKLDAWINGKEKVIFKGWKNMKYNGYYLQLGCETNILSYETSNSSAHISEPKTIDDLFQATNGELEIQNVNI